LPSPCAKGWCCPVSAHRNPGRIFIIFIDDLPQPLDR
jgi:hypothetical protein